MKTHLYFAYGMNTNAGNMEWRCPSAVSLGHARLVDHMFRFSTHADVVKQSGSFVDGVLWEITDECLASLDQLEGFPFYYNRREKTVAIGDRMVRAITYYMQPGHVNEYPTESYFSMVEAGYQEHNVPVEQLYNALDAIDA